MRVTTALTLVAAAIFYLNLNSGTWLISPDSTLYVEGAKSLAGLRGYLDATGAPQAFFPPGTSALYALPASLPSSDFFFLNLFTKFLAIAFIGLAYLVARRSAGDGVALTVIVFLALSANLITESTRIRSDLAFSATFMLTLWLFPREKLEGMRARGALGLGCMVACCYLMRAAGVFVVLGYVACVALTVHDGRLRTIALVSAVFVIVAAALWLRAGHVGARYSYLQLMFLKEPWVLDSGVPGLLDWRARLASNLGTALGCIYFAFSNQDRLLPGGVIICLLIVLGFAADLQHRRAPLHLCLLGCYVPALLLQPYGPDHRYFLPILPLLALLAVAGARMASTWLRSEQQKRLFWLALVVVVSVNSYWPRGFAFAGRLRGELDRAGGAPIIYQGHEAFLDVVKRHRDSLTRGDSVATMHASILRYFLPADVRVSSFALTEDVEELYRELRHGGTTHIYCDKTVDDIWRFLEPVIRTHASSFELVVENQDAAVYEMRPAEAITDPGAFGIGPSSQPRPEAASDGSPLRRSGGRNR